MLPWFIEKKVKRQMIEKWKKESLYEFMIHRKEGPHTVLFMVRECFNNIMILNKKEINLLIRF